MAIPTSIFRLPPDNIILCASRQSKSEMRALAHFSAEPGRVYYFTVKKQDRPLPNYGIDFGPLDSDEGVLSASTFLLSTSQLKK